MTDTTVHPDLDEAQRRISALEQQIERMRQQEEVLLYTLSHDLRSPVMTILGFTDMLITDLKEVSEDQVARQYLEHIRNSASRQAMLIESLLQLSRLSRQTLHPTAVDLTRIAFDYWHAQPGLTDDKRQVVKLLSTPAVSGDPELLTVMLQALLNNAIKFSRKVAAPQISFGAEQNDGKLSFYVRDNGAGFNAERAERLFHPFRRLHSSRDFEGLGMGLAIAALVIRRHHGQVWVDSAVDQGTTVHFTLGAL